MEFQTKITYHTYLSEKSVPQLKQGFPGGSEKNLPAMQETQVQSLGWEDPLQKGMTTHSSILAQRIPWTEKPGGLSPWDLRESDTTE